MKAVVWNEGVAYLRLQSRRAASQVYIAHRADVSGPLAERFIRLAKAVADRQPARQSTARRSERSQV